MSDTISFNPYLFFNRNCEEAVNYYVKVIGGNIEEMNQYGDSPMVANAEDKSKIIHARFRLADSVVMACDSLNDVPPSNQVSLTLGLKDDARAREIFAQLADGGKVIMPFEKQFWGAHFGQLVDRFGIRWMINCD